jgi:hypothetical protein
LTGVFGIVSLACCVSCMSLCLAAMLRPLTGCCCRYLRFLKRSHDAVHITESWKRRNPPGIIMDGNDRVLREVTLVVTDVEVSRQLP